MFPLHFQPGARYTHVVTTLDLQRKLHDKLFKPFRIRLVNNITHDIQEPWMIIVGESSAVIVTQARTSDKRL